MRLSEIQGEEAIEVLADIIEPVSTILADEKVTKIARERKYPKAIAVAMRSYKREILDILAALNQEDPKTYKPPLLSIPKQLLDLANEPEIEELFMQQSQIKTTQPSGSVTENTEEEGQ